MHWTAPSDMGFLGKAGAVQKDNISTQTENIPAILDGDAFMISSLFNSG
jgi:hypothetical protein